MTRSTKTAPISEGVISSRRKEARSSSFSFLRSNPIILHTDDDNNDQPAEDMLIREQQRRMKVRDEDEAVLARHNKQRSQHNDIRLSLNDLWKRGGDFCGCNMGCFYHSAGQCASCCSLGLR
uniref:Uncharacterized protein n=1 Tax=Globodera pallida TaxID=36090 RepID=A0A183CD98_GLOPA